MRWRRWRNSVSRQDAVGTLFQTAPMFHRDREGSPTCRKHTVSKRASMFHRDQEVSPTCEKVLELEPGNKHAMETLVQLRE